jgi:hypothetical protein
VRHGFARKRNDDDPEDGSEQEARIINFDKSPVSIDNTSGERGGQLPTTYYWTSRIVKFDESPVSIDNTSGESSGRPPATFYSTSLPAGATAVNKSGFTCTIICGLTSDGTPIPPHLELKTAAKTADREQINIATL